MNLDSPVGAIRVSKTHPAGQWTWLALLVCGLLVVASIAPAQAAPSEPFSAPTAKGTSSPGLASRWKASPSNPTARLQLSASTAAAGTTSSVRAPDVVALDRRTQTLYVGAGDGDGRLYVLDARTCKVPRARCGEPLASVATGVDTADVAVDPGTGTVYVSNFNDPGSGTVAVVDGRHCNARDVSGCERPVTQLGTGGHALGLQLDRRTHTLYVGNTDSYVSVIDTHTCNATHTSGCNAAPARATTGTNAAFPYLDRTTDTLYVPQNDFNDGGDVVDIIDTRTCNAGDTSGCSRTPATFRVGLGAAFAVVDHRTGTLYVSNQDGGGTLTGTASVVDARTCNARTTLGCPVTPPPTALIGPGAVNLAVAPATHSLYGLASDSDVVSVIDTRRCRAHDTSGCGRPPRTVQTGVEPFWMLLDRRTGSLYLANHADNTVQVIDATRCSGVRSGGCRKTPPVAPATGNTRVVGAVHTIYQGGNFDLGPDHALTFIDTRTCNLSVHADCRARASIDIGYSPRVYVDPGSYTLYLVDGDAGVVHLIDMRGCNVSRQTGCAPFADVPIPSVGGLDITPRTHTVYAGQFGLSTVAVLPGEHCNALDHTRCDGPVREVELGGGANVAAFDLARDTVYIATPDADPDRGTLTLLPSAACDAGSAACTAVARTAVAGGPISQQLVPAVHSLYVSGGFGANVLTVVDTRACNAHHTSGCATAWPTAPMPHAPFAVEYDRPADKVVVTSWDANLTVLDPRVCSAVTPSGCGRTSPRIAVGFRPVYFGMDPQHNTLYTFNFYDQTVSLINLAHPCRPHLCVMPRTPPR